MIEIWTLDKQSSSNRVRIAGELLEAIGSDAAYFTPHPMTKEHAHSIASDPGADTYAIISMWNRGIAYGMLRGWEDYKVPSLGIAVHPMNRGSGLGKLMMEYLHTVARLRNAPAIRLRVHPNNESAIALYEKLGYRWQPELDRGQRVGILTL